MATLPCSQGTAACLRADSTRKDQGHTLNQAWWVGQEKMKMAVAKHSGEEEGHVTSGERKYPVHTRIHTHTYLDVEEGRECAQGQRAEEGERQ